MRVLICGDRNWTDRKTIEKYIQSLPKDTIVVQGGCRGADYLAASIAIENGLIVKTYEAKWQRYGKAAGPIRNQQMLDEFKPHFVVAFHNDLSKSRGTRDMINRATKKGVPVQVIKSDNQQTEG